MGRDEAASLLDRPLSALSAAAEALALEFPGALVIGAALALRPRAPASRS